VHDDRIRQNIESGNFNFDNVIRSNGPVPSGVPVAIFYPTTTQNGKKTGTENKNNETNGGTIKHKNKTKRQKNKQTN
jgi:hypothetical protein